MSLVLAIIALVVAIVSAVAAIGSWRTAIRANKTAGSVARIETARRHAELTPEFKVTLTRTGNSNDEAYLDVKLIHGPSAIDEVVISILDETGQDHWARGLPANLSQHDADLFIWGPWEFNIGAREQVENYRSTKPRPYSQLNGKNWDHLHMVRTRAGAWMAGHTNDQWQAEHSGPLRLKFTCKIAGHEPWYVLYEVAWDGMR